MAKTKNIDSLVGWYIVLPSSGPEEITYQVVSESPSSITIHPGTAFHQRSEEEVRDRKMLTDAMVNEGVVTLGPGHLYYFIAPTAGGWELTSEHDD